MKSPCLYPAWYDEWDDWLTEYAEKNGVEYLNAIPRMEEMGIDLNTDTYDGGIHLNVYGVEKYTRWFGAWLSERVELEDERNDLVTASRYGALATRYEWQKTEGGRGA